ncbi:MAG: four-carbon acid sugar kinase family protein [Betaproteobacteria bacterium]|nr:four-carbon acid sugar kinase family protein [Betaproteobacteria bacterium]MDH5222969.1 four-carbon acid sugar kinase family protein [Betaproteobacteria bacterium]MDH5351833.1 four-carbon acid sugar kinase family protein [Betaproteobacteria bacterium]
MRLACIADDLTGATDLGVTLAREGFSVVQVNGVPGPDLTAPRADAVVVALKSRTNTPAQAVTWSLESLAWLRRAGAQRVYFKVCSTFDSTPRGNIGPVADALMEALDAPFAPVTPAYPRNARTVYRGNLFVGEVPLAESGMRNHPLTPMTDSNLVRVLSAQTKHAVGLVGVDAVETGVAAVRARIEALRKAGARYGIVDAIRDEHLVAAGEACADMALAVGGAGLAMGIARALAKGAKRTPGAALPKVGGGAAILSGSCSDATLAQVEAASAHYPALHLDPAQLDVDAALAWAKPKLGAGPVLFYTSAPASARAKGRADAIEQAFRGLARGLAAAGVRRFVVAGGETSGAVAEALGVRALAIGPEIAPGVPWTAALGGEPMLLALKSGNFGGPDFFTRAFEAQP